MRRLLITIALLALPTLAHAQPQAGPAQAFGLDYRAADVTTYQVTRFEMSVDGATFTSVGIPSVVTDSGTTSGHQTYRVPIPALTVGNHTVAFRACNASACSTSTAPFAFAFVVVPVPAVNVRIIG